MEKAVNKNTAACCSKRAVGKRKKRWPDSALRFKLEQQLLDMLDGKSCLDGCQEDGGVRVCRLALSNFDITLFCDVDFKPVAGWDDKVCVHEYTIQAKVRRGKLICYEVRGQKARQLFFKVMPTKKGE